MAVLEFPHTGSTPDARDALRAGARHWATLRGLLWPEAAAVTLILGLSAGLNLVALDQEGFGNTYYAAAVWSMLQNWHAFLFASFDASGFVSVDKPPVGLWLQVLSARLLGFNGLALLLPQALAGVASVALVYVLVRRAFGAVAAGVAALVLAVTPISVVTDRNNTMDGFLVLMLLLAVLAVSLAAERGSLGWLLIGAALVGLGFNVKMLQAYPVVPGLALAYLAFAPLRWRRRFADLALALVVLLAVSLSWSVFVDLTPAGLRPFVGSSGTNSALSLALGYNGLSRITLALAQQFPALNVLGTQLDLQVAPLMAPGIGSPGLLRLLAPSLAGQASWMLPFALVGLLAGAVALGRRRRNLPARDLPPVESPMALGQARRRQMVSLVVWGGWLLAWAAIFSFARFYHVYYLIMLGPGVAALTGIGLVSLWQMYRDTCGNWRRWLLPATLVASLWLELGVVSTAPSVRDWLTPLLVGGTLVAVAALLVEYIVEVRHAWLAQMAVALGTASLLVAPLAWSVTSVQNGNGGGWLVQAGPVNNTRGGFGGPGAQQAGGFGGPGAQQPAGLPGPGAQQSAGFGGGRAGARGVPGGVAPGAVAAAPGGGGAGIAVTGGAPGAQQTGGQAGAPSGVGSGGAPGAQQTGGQGGGQAGTPGGAATGGPSVAQQAGGFGGLGAQQSAGSGGGRAGARGGPGGFAGGAGPGGVTGGGGPGGFAGTGGGGGAPFGFGFGGGGGGAMTFAGSNWNQLNPSLVSYLEANQGSADYLVATTTSSYASLFILDSGQPAMALGGYQGWDRILTPPQLAQMVANGAVRFFYLPDRAPAQRGGGTLSGSQSSMDGTSDLVAWVSGNCGVVQDGGWPTAGGLQLYDCQLSTSQA